MRNKRIEIAKLSRNELLGLIYHNLPNTIFNDHPVFCASCAKGYEADLVSISQDLVVAPLGYICDRCEEND
jgi:hypothetical protein